MYSSLREANTVMKIYKKKPNQNKKKIVAAEPREGSALLRQAEKTYWCLVSGSRG